MAMLMAATSWHPEGEGRGHDWHLAQVRDGAEEQGCGARRRRGGRGLGRQDAGRVRVADIADTPPLRNVAQLRNNDVWDGS